MFMRDILGKVAGASAAERRTLPASATHKPVSDAERLALLDSFESADIGWFWSTDSDGRLTYLSPTAIKRFGEGRQVTGSLLAELFETVAEDGEGAGERPLKFFLGAHARFRELVVRLQGVQPDTWWSITGQPYHNAKGDFEGFRGSAKDISSEFIRQRDQARMAQYDTLTGLANRYRMGIRLDQILTAIQASKRSCALMMIDLDRFTQVNDTMGHPAGDELLRQVAQRLERVLPAGSEIGRLGGDEFQIILPDQDDRGNLGEIAHRLIQMISQPYSINGARAIIGTSVGIAIAPYDGVTSKELVKNADLALYAAKGGGRAQYRFYSADLQDGANLRREIEEDLRDAIALNSLEVFYQPVVRASDGQLCGFEALLRWNHPERGYISPTDFMPVAEETGLIVKLGEWTMRKACMDATQWPDSVRVAVNVSAAQFMQEDLVRTVEQALDASGLNPERLELEITETVFMGDMQQVDGMFTKLKRLGVKLSLDDFGTGYSSLGYLSRAPFDKIKIDQCFVRGCTEKDNANSAIIAAIVSLAEALGLETTAEGVEALDELRIINQRGATNIQGYIYSEALPLEEATALANSKNTRLEASGPENARSDRQTVFKRVGVIHEDHYYQVTLRNISRTGALIEGLLEVPVGAELVLDLGGGQLAVAKVVRSNVASQGIEFETPLISDGANGLCTRHRISPYVLAAAGLPLQPLGNGSYQSFQQNRPSTRPRFLQVEVSGSGGPA